MSTLKAKVRRQFVKVVGKDMYVAHTLPGVKIGMEDMIRLAAEDSGMTEAMVAASFYALSKQFEQMLMNGIRLIAGCLALSALRFRARLLMRKKKCRLRTSADVGLFTLRARV